MPSLKRNLLTFACLAVFGCGPEYELDFTNYYVKGGGVENDSTIIFLQIVEEVWREGAGPFGGVENADYKIREISLNLADNRTEKIYWKKDIINKDGYIVDLHLSLTDSVLFFIQDKYGFKSKFAILKLGDVNFQEPKPIELKYKEINLIGKAWGGKDWPKIGSNLSFRPWHSGLVLASKGKNERALLDTATGTMEVWEPSGEFEWLNECVDVKWSRVGGLCLKGIPDTLGFVLLKNGVDTLAIRYTDKPRGNNIKLSGFYGNGIILNGWIYLMNNQGKVSEMPLDIWVAGAFYSFYDLYGNQLVQYAKRFVN